MPNLPNILGGIAAGLQHLSERQRVIAGNIANSDTPGFKSRTVEQPDFGAMLNVRSGGARVARPTVTLTSGMAALGASPPPAAGRIVEDRNVTETKPDGNNVTLEDQVMALGQVQADYATLTSLYAKQMKLLKIALGRGGQ